jgi:hypothetical protein
VRARTGQHDSGKASIQEAAAVGVQRGRKTLVEVARGCIDDLRKVIVGGLNVGCGRMMTMHVAVRTMAVRIPVMVVVTCRRRHMMIGAERTVRCKCKRRHDRQSGREALGQQSDVTNHTGTDSRCVSQTLVAAIGAVQTGQSYKSGRNARICGIR